MNLAKSLELPGMVSELPPGAVNVLVGDAVEGPGGRWVPCASAIADGIYVSCVFQVGQGLRQVCADDRRTGCAHEALRSAVELAAIAAA